MSRSLLIYDDSQPGFEAVGDLLARGMADCRPVPWQAEQVQAFLDAQFDDRPFSLILVEDDTVYVGENAVERLLQTAGVGESLADLIKRAYPPFSAPFGRLVHGREPDDLHGAFPLADDARDHLESLRAGHTIPVTEE